MPSLDGLLIVVAVAFTAPFLVATTTIGRELGLVGAGEAALVGAGLLSVLLLPAAGLALLQRDLRRFPTPASSAV